LAVDRRYTAANAALWAASFMLISARVSLDSMSWPLSKAFQMGLRRLGVTLVAFGFCEVMWRLLRRFQVLPLGLQALAAVAVAIVGAFVYGETNHVLMYNIAPLATPPDAYSDVVMLASLQVWVFVAWGAIMIALGYEEAARQREVRLLSAEKLATESQLAMLRYQLNPHFLFNALNALSELILAQQTRRAERLLLALSRFLRRALQGAAQTKAPLADEIWVQQQYLTIEKIRYGRRLAFSADVTPEAAKALAPSMILQPLVENAVKHGVARSTGPVRLEIAAERIGEVLRLTVRDDAQPEPGEAADSLGVGLVNIRQRLHALYGAQARLEAGAQSPHGYAARIELPYETEP
jgi:two-component system LytT family sensor kinase